MTALQWIIKEAKIIRKKSPKMEWKKAVAQASAIYASKHKGKSPIGKKKAAPKKKAAKKRIGLSVVKKAAAKVKRFARNAQDAFYEGYYEGKPIELSKKRAELKKKRVKSAKRKKISEQSILNKIHKVKDDVNKLDEAQHRHMIGSVNKLLQDYRKIIDDIQNSQKIIDILKESLKNAKRDKVHASAIANWKIGIKKYTNLLKEYKTHAKELKKHI